MTPKLHWAKKLLYDACAINSDLYPCNISIIHILIKSGLDVDLLPQWMMNIMIAVQLHLGVVYIGLSQLCIHHRVMISVNGQPGAILSTTLFKMVNRLLSTMVLYVVGCFSCDMVMESHSANFEQGPI